MHQWGVTVAQCKHRCGRRQNCHFTNPGAGHRMPPSVEAKWLKRLIDPQMRPVAEGQHDRPIGKVPEERSPQFPIAGPRETSATGKPLCCEAPVQNGRTHEGVLAECLGHSQLVVPVVAPPTEAAWPMACGKCDGIIEKEQRCPCSGCRKGVLAFSEVGIACDPQISHVVTHDGSGVVYKTASVPGEKTALVGRVEISPWIDSIGAWHPTIVAVIACDAARRAECDLLLGCLGLQSGDPRQ